MDYAGFLFVLQREIIESILPIDRRIIRFRRSHDFAQCTDLLMKWKNSIPKLASVRPIRMIRAFCCSLKSSQSWFAFQQEVWVEDDAMIQMNGFTMLPTPVMNPMKLDRKDPVIPWGVKQVKAPQLWNRTTGQRVKIGVVDTGVDFSHPDLQDALSHGINLIHRYIPPFDDNGHGTHIAGTIAAAGKRYGIFGVAPDATIHAVKAFDYRGSAFVSDIIMGIDWCVRYKMDIINMSFGMKNRSSALQEAVKSATQAGIVIVASSGNENKQTSVDYPANFPQTISVGATNRNKKIASFSNRGKSIDIYAPGERVISTWIGGKYNQLSGTSMATSHVTGVIALLLALKPGMNPSQIKTLLTKTANPLSIKKNGWRPVLIDAKRALQYAQS